jgi:hypothetical protein
VVLSPASLILALEALTLGDPIGALRCTAEPEPPFHECILPDRFVLMVACGSVGRPHSKTSSAIGAGELQRTGVLDVEARLEEDDVTWLEVEFEEVIWAGRSSVAIVLLRNCCFVMCEESSAMCRSVLSRRRE